MKPICFLYVGIFAALVGALLSIFISCIYFYVAIAATAVEIQHPGLLFEKT